MDQSQPGPARWYLGGCFAIFLIPFFIAGVTVIRNGIRILHYGDQGAWLLIAVGVLLTAFSVGIFALIAFALRRGQAAARRISVNPAQPWLWREDWAERRIAEGGAAANAALWVFAAMWNAITIPMALVFGRQFPKNPYAAIAFLFAAIGLALVGGAVYSTLQRRKFGRSICAIDRLPIEPGQTFSGTIEHRGTQVPDAGYRLVLSCINRIVTSRGRNRSTSDEVLWETEQRISGGVAAPSPAGMSVPFSFEIPPDARSADLRTPSDLILWQLRVTAELPGIDYKATFELPVFATADKFAAHYAARREEAARRALPPESRVTETPLPSGGIELRVAPLRDVRAFTVFILFGAIWFGAIALLWRVGTPSFFAVIFSLFGVLILALAIDFFAGTSIVSADRSGLRARRVVFGIPKSTSLDTAQIESIEPKVGGHAGRHPYFDVEARLRGGVSRTLARYLDSRSDAETVAAKLWSALRG